MLNKTVQRRINHSHYALWYLIYLCVWKIRIKSLAFLPPQSSSWRGCFLVLLLLYGSGLFPATLQIISASSTAAAAEQTEIIWWAFFKYSNLSRETFNKIICNTGTVEIVLSERAAASEHQGSGSQRFDYRETAVLCVSVQMARASKADRRRICT